MFDEEELGASLASPFVITAPLDDYDEATGLNYEEMPYDALGVKLVALDEYFKYEMGA